MFCITALVNGAKRSIHAWISMCVLYTGTPLRMPRQATFNRQIQMCVCVCPCVSLSVWKLHPRRHVDEEALAHDRQTVWHLESCFDEAFKSTKNRLWSLVSMLRLQNVVRTAGHCNNPDGELFCCKDDGVLRAKDNILRKLLFLACFCPNLQ